MAARALPLPAATECENGFFCVDLVRGNQVFGASALQKLDVPIQ